MGWGIVKHSERPASVYSPPPVSSTAPGRHAHWTGLNSCGVIHWKAQGPEMKGGKPRISACITERLMVDNISTVMRIHAPRGRYTQLYPQLRRRQEEKQQLCMTMCDVQASVSPAGLWRSCSSGCANRYPWYRLRQFRPNRPVQRIGTRRRWATTSRPLFYQRHRPAEPTGGHELLRDRFSWLLQCSCRADGRDVDGITE